MMWIFKDHQVQIGSIGASLTLAGKWIFDHINPLLGMLAGIGGLIIVAYSIMEKRKRVKIADMELRIKEEELRQLKH